MDRVLVVDDHVANCVPLRKLFRYADIAAQCALGGREALTVLAEQRFELVLLDVMMPEVDGFGVLAAIRADPRHAATAVLMYTAVTDPDVHARALRMGAQGSIVKGTSFADLLAVVRPYLLEQT